MPGQAISQVVGSFTLKWATSTKIVVHLAEQIKLSDTIQGLL